MVIDPGKLAAYGLRPDILIAGFAAGNQLVAAGALEGSEGRYAIKLPSLLESIEDVANLPVVSTGTATVRVRDIAEIRPTLKEPDTVTRLTERRPRHRDRGLEARRGQPDPDGGRGEGRRRSLPPALARGHGHHLQPGQVQGHPPAAVRPAELGPDGGILVFIVILYALSVRASLLIGLAIPASFLMGMLVLSLWGYTVNIVVLFSLILAVGMLVDDAIIVTEYAERRMSEGMDKREAFAMASHKMTGPVVAATMTRVAAFSPLLFWRASSASS